MILFASGRTDIPAFYSNWFLNRVDAGFIDVRNPFNQNLISRINFSDVDLIMFCSKNPIPIIDKLDQIKFPILFHITRNIMYLYHYLKEWRTMMKPIIVLIL